MSEFEPVRNKNGKLRFEFGGKVYVGKSFLKSRLKVWLPHEDKKNVEAADASVVWLYVLEDCLGEKDFVSSKLFYEVKHNGIIKIDSFSISDIKDSYGKLSKSLYQTFILAGEISFYKYTENQGNPMGRFCMGIEDMQRQIQLVNKAYYDVLNAKMEDLVKGMPKPIPEIVNIMDRAFIRIFSYPWGYGCVLKEMAVPPYSVKEENIRKALEIEQLVKKTNLIGSIQTVIYKSRIERCMYNKRGISQKQLMGISANELARQMGICDAQNSDFEWLHMIAHRFGINGEDAQTAENLVLGTYYANSQMLMIEEALTWAVQNESLECLVNVSVDRLPVKGDQLNCLASRLNYQYSIMKINEDINIEVYGGEIKFNPFSRYWPDLFEYRMFLELFKNDLKNALNVIGETTLQNSMPLLRGSKISVDCEQKKSKDSRTLGIGSIPLNNLAECTVENNVFRPLEKNEKRVRLMAGPRAYTGQINALEKNNIPVKMALLTNGDKLASLDYSADHFKLDQLFSELNCTNLDLLVLKDTHITIKELQNESSLLRLEIGGKLNLDIVPLSIFKEFMGVDSELYVCSTILVASDKLSGKLEPCGCIFSSAGTMYVNLGSHFILKNLRLDILMGRSVDLEKGELGWKLMPSLNGKFIVSHFSKEPFTLSCSIGYFAEILRLEATGGSAENFLGIKGFSVEDICISLELGRESEAAISAAFPLGLSMVSAGGALGEKGAGIYTELEYFTLYELEELYRTLSGNTLDYGEYDILFENVFLSAASADMQVRGKALKKGLNLKAKVRIHEFVFGAEIAVSNEGVLINGYMEQLTFEEITIKEASLHLEFGAKDAGKAARFYIEGKTQLKGMELSCRVDCEKVKGEWNFGMYAGLEAEAVTLGKMFPEVQGSFVDSIGFERLGFLYVTKDRSYELFDKQWNVEKGLQVIGTIYPVKQLEVLTGAGEEYDIQAHFGQTSSVCIHGGGNLNLGKGVTCTPFTIGVQLTPKPSFYLVFGMDVSVPGQEQLLHFDLMMDIDSLQAKGSATMKNWWEEPFGIKHLKIGPAVALQLGIIYEQFMATGTPSEFGIAGGLMLGDVEIQMAVNISENPMEEILMGSLSKLTMTDVVGIVESLLGVKLHDNELPDYFTVEDINLYCAPAGGKIGTIVYEKGFIFSGRLLLFGKKAEIYARLMDNGFVIKGGMECLDLGILKIGGKKGKDLLVDIEISSDNQHCLLDGEIEILGCKKGIFLSVSKNGLAFEYEENFLSLLTFTMKASSVGTVGDLSTLDFILEAEFDNKISEYIQTTVLGKIEQAIQTVEHDIKEAEIKVEKTKQQYEMVYKAAADKLSDAQKNADEWLQKCTQDVENERRKFVASVEDAESEVKRTQKAYEDAITAAQREVDRAEEVYKKAMDNAKREVDRAEHEYNDALNDAIRQVQDARKVYDKAFGDAKRDLDKAQKDVDDLQRLADKAIYELKHLAWYEYIYMGPYLSAEIAGLETAYGVATGVLEACKGVLIAVQYGTEYTAWEAAEATLQAVKYGIKYTAFETAKGVLEATKYGAEYAAFESAKGTLELVKTGTEYTVWKSALATLEIVKTTGDATLKTAEYALEHIGETEVYIALEICRQAVLAVGQSTEFLAFESAKAALEAARIGSEGMLRIAAEILKGSTYVLDIKRVYLSSSLKKIESGSLFQTEIDLVLLGTEHKLFMDFDLSNEVRFVDELFTSVMDKLSVV